MLFHLKLSDNISNKNSKFKIFTQILLIWM